MYACSLEAGILETSMHDHNYKNVMHNYYGGNSNCTYQLYTLELLLVKSIFLFFFAAILVIPFVLVRSRGPVPPRLSDGAYLLVAHRVSSLGLGWGWRMHGDSASIIEYCPFNEHCRGTTTALIIWVIH